MDKKDFIDSQIRNVGNVTAVPEVQVKMPFKTSDGRDISLFAPASTYYVAFEAYDEYEKFQCIIKTTSFQNISAVKEELDRYEKSGEKFALLQGNVVMFEEEFNFDRVLDVTMIIPKKYSC